MRIGELSSRAGVTPRTVRHYEQLGLLSAGRTSNGYRDYGDGDLRLLEQVRTLVDLGFTLNETKPFLACLRDGNDDAGSCPDSLAGYADKLAEIDALLVRLTTMRNRIADDYRAAAGRPGAGTSRPPAQQATRPLTMLGGRDAAAPTIEERP